MHHNSFMDYSARYWVVHFREAGTMNESAIVISALKICDPDSKSYSTWFGIYWETTNLSYTNFTDLIIASYFGHDTIVKLLLDRGVEVDFKDEDGRTPLSWVAEYGQAGAIQILLDKGAEIDSKDSVHGQTPLAWAAKKGREAVVKLLIDKGAQIDAKG